MRDNLRISYTSNAGDIYVIDINKFADEEIPRQTIGQTSIGFAVLGTAYATGPTVSQPQLWTVNTFLQNSVTGLATKNSVNYNEVALLKELYGAWDADRANGLAAKCNITDDILSFGTSYTAEAWFTEPPVYAVVGNYGSRLINCVFGLTEV